MFDKSIDDDIHDKFLHYGLNTIRQSIFSIFYKLYMIKWGAYIMNLFDMAIMSTQNYETMVFYF